MELYIFFFDENMVIVDMRINRGFFLYNRTIEMYIQNNFMINYFGFMVNLGKH